MAYFIVVLTSLILLDIPIVIGVEMLMIEKALRVLYFLMETRLLHGSRRNNRLLLYQRVKRNMLLHHHAYVMRYGYVNY